MAIISPTGVIRPDTIECPPGPPGPSGPKIVRSDYWDRPDVDWLCRSLNGGHFFESVPISRGRFFVMRCTHCGLTDPCGVPLEYLELELKV
jgi:hypothetical protein